MTDVTANQFQTDVNDASEWSNGDKNHTQTFRLGQTADSPAKVINDIRNLGSEAAGSIQFTVKGQFQDGFVINYYYELGEAIDGTIYRYTSPNALPFTVPAGLDPSSDSRFEIWINSDHNNLTGRDAASAHPSSSIDFSEFSTTSESVANNSKKIDVKNWSSINGDKTQATTIYNSIAAGIEFQIPEKTSSLKEVFARWWAGEKYPVCFFGDSTTDGATTTIDGTNPATVFNRDKLVSGNVPDGFNDDHDDSEVPNAFPNTLQRLARTYIAGNTALRTYNAGYRSQRMDNGWATTNVFNAVYGNAAYSDLKMIVINFGLNDINASGSNLSQLATNTSNYLEALVLDAYARGVQPAIATTVVTSYSEAPYPNGDTVSVIDNVKRRIADKYGIDLIDLSKAQLDYMYYNGQSESYWTISGDNLHLNDRGNLLQSQFIFQQMAGEMVMSVRDGDNYIDLTHPAMRLNGNDGTNLSKTVGLNRGLNQRYRTLTATTAYYTGIAGEDVYDLWVWNDKPRSGLIYCKFLDESVVPSNVSNKSNLPQFNVASDFGTINDTYAVTDSYLDPNFIGGPAGGGRAVTETFMQNLRYGLSRVRMSIPSTIDTSFISGSSTQIGFLKVETDNIESENSTITSSDNNVTDFNFSDFHDVINFRQSRSGVNNEIMTPYNNKNRFSLRRIGDYVEFNVNASWIANSGVILGYTLFDNTASTTPIGVKRENITSASYVALTSAGTALRLNFYSPSGVQTLDLNPFTGGDDAFASYVNKDLIIRLTLAGNEQMQVEAFDSSLNNIGTGQNTPSTSQGLVFVRNMQSAYVGGFRTFSASTDGLLLNRLSYRVKNN